MLPLKDNIPTDRLPLVTLLLIGAGIAAHVVLRGDGELLRLLADALFLWIFGPSVEDAMSRPRFLAFCLFGGVVAAGVQLALDPDTAAGTLSTAGAAGAVAAVVGGHARLYRTASVVAILLVPLFFRVLEPPAWIFVALWLAVQAAFAVAGEPGWLSFAAQAVGFAVGLLAIPAFAQRVKQPPPPSAIPAPS